MCPTIYLTFDCEDFINNRSIFVLHRVLQLLHEYDVKGLFFLTGHMAEKISNFPDILDLLESHEIGYHSSAHSVRPIIVEYTDVKDYALARQISLKRETSHINPLTGECEEKGGIIFLKALFPRKEVMAFRAPGLCWSPPHLEALKELGIQFDFSTDLSPTSIRYRGLTFYPSAALFDIINIFRYRMILRTLIRYATAVLIFHPHYFVNADYWDSVYFSGNPRSLSPVKARMWKDTKAMLRRFELFLKHFSFLQKNGVLEITPPLEKSRKEPIFTKQSVIKAYQTSISWAKNSFGYNPKFAREHFEKFFSV
jgi:hypothetical protein